MKPETWKRTYWILMMASVAVMGSYQIWNLQRPSDEEVQQRIQKDLEVQEKLQEVRKMEAKFKADQERAFGTQDASPR